MQKISRKQIEATIQLLKTKVAMREKYLHYTTLRGTLERHVIEASRLTLCVPKEDMDAFLSAHKHQAEAMKEIELVVIAELKSQLAIHEAMLQEGDRSLVVPGSRLT
jgi:hypothetical protein